jgi:hypothetical protein
MVWFLGLFPQWKPLVIIISDTHIENCPSILIQVGTTHLRIALLRKVKILKIAQGNKRYPRAILNNLGFYG